MTGASMSERTRRWFPDSGLPYQLFDSSVLLLGLAFFWYVGSPPSEVTKSTVGDIYAVLLSPRGWGMGLMLSGAVGIVCSYLCRRWWNALLAGYLLMIAATGGWSVALALGVVLAEPSTDLALKALGSSLLFAWICRGLLAAVKRVGEVAA